MTCTTKQLSSVTSNSHGKQKRTRESTFGTPSLPRGSPPSLPPTQDQNNTSRPTKRPSHHPPKQQKRNNNPEYKGEWGKRQNMISNERGRGRHDPEAASRPRWDLRGAAARHEADTTNSTRPSTRGRTDNLQGSREIDLYIPLQQPRRGRDKERDWEREKREEVKRMGWKIGMWKAFDVFLMAAFCGVFFLHIFCL